MENKENNLYSIAFFSMLNKNIFNSLKKKIYLLISNFLDMH